FSGDTTACGNKPKSMDCGSSLRALREHSQHSVNRNMSYLCFSILAPSVLLIWRQTLALKIIPSLAHCRNSSWREQAGNSFAPFIPRCGTTILLLQGLGRGRCVEDVDLRLCCMLV